MPSNTVQETKRCADLLIIIGFQIDANDVEGKISLLLDAWMSSNNYAFLAIVAHHDYIMKTSDHGMIPPTYCQHFIDKKIEELLIDG